jgi:Uma2 family endonuclease
MASTPAVVTPADLLQLPQPSNGRHYELSSGELIVVGNAGARHERIEQRIVTSLILWAARASDGEIFAASQFTLGPHTARIPDAAFVSAAKLAQLPDADVAIPFAPDLPVEVISASECASNAETKVAEYLAGGVQEVWQIYPKLQRVRIRRPDFIRDLGLEDTLDSPVLPRFSIPVKQFFTQ